MHCCSLLLDVDGDRYGVDGARVMNSFVWSPIPPSARRYNPTSKVIVSIFSIVIENEVARIDLSTLTD